MSKKISGEIWGYAIRHPGLGHYEFGRDPKELTNKFYEGFNPVCALVRLDHGHVFDGELDFFTSDEVKILRTMAKAKVKS